MSSNDNDDQFRSKLTPAQFNVLRRQGTEAPFSGSLLGVFSDGVYSCAACGARLFDSKAKYDSGSGWPSFTEPMSKSAVTFQPDNSHQMQRTEVRCANCGSHLGHVFPDQTATGQDFCINSLSLDFDPKK